MSTDRYLLLKAVQSNDICTVKDIISDNEIIIDEVYQSLIEAIDKEYLDIVSLFLKAGLDVNFEPLDGIPLERAVMTRNFHMVKLLIEGGAEVNYPLKSSDNYTPLFSAVCNGDIEIVKLLVEAGADVNYLWNCNYALEGAAIYVHEDVYNYLYPLTNPESRKEAEESLLAGISTKLRENSVNPQTRILIDAVNEDNLHLVKKMIANGVNINDQDADGFTPLITASARSRLEILNELLALGADPNAKDNDGKTALIYAVGESDDRVKICLKLIESGADVNTQDNFGKTALMEAANLGSPNSVRLLILMNADINIKDTEGKSALDYALLHSQDNYFWADNVNYPAVVEILQRSVDWVKTHDNL